jgi:hypothetical protein
MMKDIFKILPLLLFPVLLLAQDDKGNLGDKEYIIVKDYKPVLGESLKISDSPEGDTSSVNPPAMNYDFRDKKLTSDYELSTIKAVKIKDEQLAKLYRSYIKLGLGNYTTYAGDLYINALRSKKGALGFALNHFSGNPSLSDVGYSGFSHSHGGVYGKYFLENKTFSGNIDYNRDVVHYYGYNSSDTIIEKEDLKQRFNTFGMQLALASNYLNKDHVDYEARFGFSTLSDLYEVTENDFLLAGKVGKMFDQFYFNTDLSFNYFKKSLAKNESLILENDLKRSIVGIAPTLAFNKEKVKLLLGINFEVEKNLGSKIHLFPKIDISLPIAENILYVFGGVNGRLIKNSYQTIVKENPYVTAAVVPENSVNKVELKAGLNGNFSSTISFMAMVKYSTIDRMQLYVNDSLYFNKFNVIYDDGKVLNLHAELSYKASEKFNATLRFDQYGYDLDQNIEAWHKPNTEMALNLKYNFWDKIFINAAIYAHGKYYARINGVNGYSSEKVDGYMDLNLGLEYHYSKILSLFVDLNNLGFARYDLWYKYPSERFNILGGIKYSF